VLTHVCGQPVSTQALPLSALSDTFPTYLNPPPSSPSSPLSIPRDTTNVIPPSVQSEATAANLPPAVAQLRTDFLVFLRRATATHQYIAAFRSLILTLLTAHEAYASSLASALTSHGYPTPNNAPPPIDTQSLCVSISKTEGGRAFQAWSSIITSILQTIKVTQPLVASLQTVVQVLATSPAVVNGEKMIKTTREAGDLAWKNIQDAGRLCAKAESRWRAGEGEVKRTAARLEAMTGDYERELEIHSAAGLTTDAMPEGGGKSVDALDEKDSDFGSGVRKLVGGVLSSLGGGEDVMNKIVSTKERVEMCQDEHEKALVSLHNAKIHVDACQKAMGEKCELYAVAFKETFGRLKADEEVKQELCMESVQKCVEAFGEFVERRKSAIGRAGEELKPHVEGGEILQDRAEWARKIERKIRRKNEEVEKRLKEEEGEEKAEEKREDDDAEDGFNVQIRLVRNQTVYKLLSEAISYKPEDLEAAGSSDEPCDSDAATEATIKSVAALVREFAVTHEQSEKIAKSKDSRVQQSFEHHFMDNFSSHEVVEEEEEEEGAERAGEEEEGGGEEKEERVEKVEAREPKEVRAKTPRVVESFSCSFWPTTGGGISPLVHGRIFVTANAIYFVGWGSSKVVINVSDIEDVTRQKTAGGTVDNALEVTLKGGEAFFFGSFAFRQNCFALIDRLRAVKGGLVESGLVEEPKPPNVAPAEGSEEGGGEDVDLSYHAVTLGADACLAKMQVSPHTHTPMAYTDGPELMLRCEQGRPPRSTQTRHSPPQTAQNAPFAHPSMCARHACGRRSSLCSHRRPICSHMLLTMCAADSR